MRVNSEAIYGTRSIAPYKEGRVCWTRKGHTIYLIVLAEKNETAPPARVKAPSLKQAKQVRMLGAAEAITWSTSDGGGPHHRNTRRAFAARPPATTPGRWRLGPNDRGK